MLNHIRRDLAVLAGFVALGLFLVGTDARARAQDKKQDPKPGLPDLEKLLPPGTLDPEQMKQLKKLFEGQKENMKQMLEDLQKQLQGQFPNFELPDLPRFGMAKVARENRLGAELQKPSKTLVDQLDLADNQGIVLKSVKAQSAAAKAGLKSSDILLELDGKAVPSQVEDFVKQLNEIKKDSPVDAVVLRKGKRQTVKGLKLGDVPAAPAPLGGLPGLPGGGFQFQQGQGPGGVSISQSHGADGSFTTKYQAGDVAIHIKGKVEDEKANIASIEIRDGDKTNTYQSVDEVPANLRDEVRALIRSAETGEVFQKGKLLR
jgi:membrane-associated protease RseP (regulator of RpoE activity)